MAFLLKSTNYNRMFKMIDSADHISKKTGLTCTVNLSKDGGSIAAAGGTVAEVSNGWYRIGLNTTDTGTAGDLVYYITATGADDTDFVDQVVDATKANLGVNVVNWNNAAVSSVTAGIPDVNLKNINNVAFNNSLAQIGTNAVQVAGTALTARDIGASVLLSTGTGTGQLDFTSGVVKANPVQWNGTAVSTPSTAGIPEVNLKNVANVAVNNSVAQFGVNVIQVGGTVQTAYDIGGKVGAPVGASISADIAAVKAETAEIDAVTDQFAFTVANQVDANALALATTLRPGIRKNTALANFEFLMTDSTNHNPATGLTVSATRSIDGGAFGAGSLGSVSELAVGIYKLDLAAGDLNGTVITLRFTATNADDLFVTIKTSP